MTLWEKCTVNRFRRGWHKPQSIWSARWTGSDVAGTNHSLFYSGHSSSNLGRLWTSSWSWIFKANDITDDSAIYWSDCKWIFSLLFFSCLLVRNKDENIILRYPVDRGTISWERVPTIIIEVVAIDYRNDWKMYERFNILAKLWSHDKIITVLINASKRHETKIVAFDTKTKAVILKTKTETIKILPWDSLEARLCLVASHHWIQMNI